MHEPAPKTLLFEILYPLGFNATQVEDICRALEGQPGKVFTSGHWRVVKDREYLLIETCQQATQPTLTMEEHILTFPETKQSPASMRINSCFPYLCGFGRKETILSRSV